MNLKFKSSEPDLKFNIQSQLRVINQNILYITRELDKLNRITLGIKSSLGLQKQVDEYFDENPEDSSQQEDKEPD